MMACDGVWICGCVLICRRDCGERGRDLSVFTYCQCHYALSTNISHNFFLMMIQHIDILLSSTDDGKRDVSTTVNSVSMPLLFIAHDIHACHVIIDAVLA